MHQLQSKEDLSPLDFAKTALMLLVVLYHSVLFWGGNWFTKDPLLPAPGLQVLASWLNSFHIYGFTLISGYLFYSLRFEHGKYARFAPFLLGKGKRLLVPYAFVLLCWVIPARLLFMGYDRSLFLHKYLLGESPGQLWFLLMLFWVFVIVWPLCRLMDAHPLLSGAALVLLYFLMLDLERIWPDVFQLLTTGKYLLFFFAGMMLCKYRRRLSGKLPFLVFLLVDLILFFALRRLPTGVKFRVIRRTGTLLLRLTGAVGAFAGLTGLAKRIRWQQSPLFACFHRHSFPIYLFHQQMIFCSIWWLNGRLSPYLHAALNIVLAATLSLLLSMLLQRFSATRFLTGQKP